MPIRRARVLLAMALLMLAGCSTIRQVTPLEQGVHRVGGPVFTNLGVPIPIPMLSVDYAYGVTDWLTMGAAVHVTPIVFNPTVKDTFEFGLATDTDHGIAEWPYVGIPKPRANRTMVAQEWYP